VKQKLIKFSYAFFFIVSTAFSQPSSQYLPHGSKSYLVNYWSIRGDPFLTDFAARQFVMIDEQALGEGRIMKKINPDLPILKYQCMVSAYPSFKNYYTILDIDERCFLHSCDPAGIQISGKGNSILLSWINDRRYSHILGYSIRVSDNDTTAGILLCDSIITNTFITSSPSQVNGKYIYVSTIIDKNNNITEARYSLPRKINIVNLPLIHHQITSFSTAGYNSNRDTINLSIKVDSSVTVNSITLQVDLNHNRTVTDAGESIQFTYSAPYWRINYSFDRTNYYAGTAFRIMLKRGTIYDTLPGGGYYYTTNINNRLRSDPYGNEVLNPANITWQDYIVGNIVEAINSGDYSGVFADNTTLGVQTWMVEVPQPLYYYSETVWNNGMIELLSKIRSKIKPNPLFFNGNVQGMSSGLLLSESDGGMFEGWCYSHWAGYVTESYWIQSLNQSLITRNVFHKIFLSLGGTKMDDPDARLFVFSSYLLIQDDSVWYANADTYQSFAHLPEMNLYLGLPLTTAQSSISELKDPSGVYIRKFEKGIVIVNPTNNKINLSGKFPEYVIKVYPGTTIEGSRIYSEKFNLTEIESRKGLILFNKPVNSPEIKSITFNPFRPTDSQRNLIISKVIGLKPLFVEASLVGIAGPMHLKMNDDGVDGDLVAGDSVFTGSFYLPLGITKSEGIARVLTYDTTGLVTISSIKTTPSPSDSLNIIGNWSFEYDTDNNGIPDLWNSYVKGFIYDTSGLNKYSGNRSIYCKVITPDTFYGAYTRIDINQSIAHDLILSGWSKAKNVSGIKNTDYSLYIDARYNDDTPLYAQCALFSVGTHDWEYSEYRIKPKKPIKSVTLYCIFRRHMGEVWFDHISLKDVTALGIEARSVIQNDYLFDAYPNPFNSEVVIKYNISRDADVNLKIYNILGQEVVSLVNEQQKCGNFNIIWNGKDTFGNRAASGIYFYRLKIGNQFKQTKKLLLLK
jgi:hypothetical protein